MVAGTKKIGCSGIEFDICAHKKEIDLVIDVSEVMREVGLKKGR